jgi:predicted ArsR family transcriptional regulator
VAETFGDDALRRTLEIRAERQTATYLAGLKTVAPSTLTERVAHLAVMRSAEGYLAEAVEDGDGGAISLIEHHCPIARAAMSCPTLCRTELEAFRAVLGGSVAVERTQHVLAGDARCVYRISPAAT